MKSFIVGFPGDIVENLRISDERPDLLDLLW
jgi:hypothetical protein